MRCLLCACVTVGRRKVTSDNFNGRLDSQISSSPSFPLFLTSSPLIDLQFADLKTITDCDQFDFEFDCTFFIGFNLIGESTSNQMSIVIKFELDNSQV